MAELGALYGRLDFVSEILPFDYTEYYYAEMGRPLVRRFASFERLVPQEDLASIKVETNRIEENSAVSGRRTVNIDPGLLSAERLVLATGKNCAHRIYLGQGIYADLTLVYHKGEYRPLEWTYGDYGEDKVREWLKALRQKYLLQLHGGSR